MPKGFAINNAPTDHGGVIQSTLLTMFQEDNAFVRAGDGHYCPKCKCWSTVVKSHDHIIMFGQSVAYVGDMLTCGARILEQQFHVVGDSQGGNNNAPDNNILSSSISEFIFEDKFKLVSKSGDVLKNINYLITRENGSIESGTTDNDGFTHIVKTNDQSEIISIKATYDY